MRVCGTEGFSNNILIPKTSHTERIAPPAIIPVPAGAAQKTLPDPFLPFTS